MPIPETVTADNGLQIESNPKHIPEMPGNRRNAGTEPSNSLDLFNSSVPGGDKTRYSIDSAGNINRFYNDGNGVYPWTGSTGDQWVPLKMSKIPIEVRRELGFRGKMLSGDPSAFAIWCDPVESWSDEKFENGCFGHFLENRFFYSSLSTLGVDLNLLSVVDSMKSSVEDQRLFSASVVDVYKELCERAFPSIDSDAEESDFKHLVSVGSLLDEGHDVFLIEWKDQARIIYGRDEDADSVMDLVLDREKFQSVVRGAIKKYKDLSHS